MPIYKYLIVGFAFVYLNGCQSGSSDSEIPSVSIPLSSSLPTVSNSSVSSSGGSCTASLRADVLALINQARATSTVCGGQSYPAVAPVTWNVKLESAALVHSTDMATNNFFSHTGSNGLDVSDRVQAQGYNWIAVGENIYAGSDSVSGLVNGWLDSAGHCQNIMNPSFKEMGVACVSNDSSRYGNYYTQVFGAQQ